ncbi:MAG: hypothetical protein HOE90_22255 [Bacteriovoracaceae bacterium]|jgi:hemerythrin-like domain-containing protein|nr:hypothetical protein [Bacteriovoracaceae bacterium]
MDKLDYKTLAKTDPMGPQPQCGTQADEDLSPMDPPESYDAALPVQVDMEMMHPFIKEMMEEHIELTSFVKTFEESIDVLQKKKVVDPEAIEGVESFFNFFESEFTPHNRKEEREFFPLLKVKLVELGEHGSGDDPVTGVDVLESEHVQAIQLAAITYHCFVLYSQIDDVNSKLTILASAIKNAKELIELLKLHIYREDKILFCQAQQLMTTEEMDLMHQKL